MKFDATRWARQPVFLILVLATFHLANAAGQAPSAPLPGLTVNNGQLLKAGRPYRGVGANYFDLFLRILAQPTNSTSLTGLAKLSRAGIPFVRFAMMYDAADMRFYLDRPAEYFRRLDLVVHTAERCDMGLIPSFNWTFALSEIAGEPRGQWGNPQSQTIKLMRRFVGDVVERYKNSSALWAWEFGNEPNLAMDLPNAEQFRPPGGGAGDDLNSAQVLSAVSEFAREVRLHDATRPMFSGNSHPRSAAWHNTKERSWTVDTKEQFREILRRDNPDPLNTITVHLYGNVPVQKDMGAWATDRPDWLTTVQDIAKQARKPLFVGEFGLPGKGDGPETKATFKEVLAQMEHSRVPIAAFWVFDFGPQSDDWSVQFDNSRSFMIRLTAEANRRWSQAAKDEAVQVQSDR